MRKAFWKAGIATAAVAAIGVGGAVAASASDSTASGSVAEASGEQCVLNVDDGKETCFDSTTEVAGFRSTGGIPFHIHVRLFPRTGYDGNAYLIGSFSKENCSEGTDRPDYQIPDLGQRSNWAGSFTTHNNCDIKAYDGLRFTGAHFAGYQDHDIELTAFNNKISALKVS
jgi:hypothetical protein